MNNEPLCLFGRILTLYILLQTTVESLGPESGSLNLTCAYSEDDRYRASVSCFNRHLGTFDEVFDDIYQLADLWLNQSSINLTEITLHRLNVSFNNLKTLQLSNPLITKLEVLDLSHNNIRELFRNSFYQVSNLTELYLDGNPIMALPPNAFEFTKNLEILSISHTALSCISSNTFAALVNLRTLRISHNKNLFSIPDSIFSSAIGANLLNLDLSHNRFTRLPTSLSYILNNNTEVLINDNLVNCYCSAKWLLDYPQISSQIICQQPAKLQGLVLNTLHPQNLSCTKNNNSLDDGNSYLVLVALDSSPVIPCLTTANQECAHSYIWRTPTKETISSDPVACSTYGVEEPRVLSNGSLYVPNFQLENFGVYTCEVACANETHVSEAIVRSKHNLYTSIMLNSILSGAACAVIFTLLSVAIKHIANALYRKYESKAETIDNIIESLKSYRATKREQWYSLMVSLQDYRQKKSARLVHFREFVAHHLHNMRSNYQTQITRTRENCAQRMENLRENYHQRLSQMKDFSSQHSDALRENYNQQLAKVREYGNTKLEVLQQRYHLQHQYLVKILQAMNLHQSCRDGTEIDHELSSDEGVFPGEGDGDSIVINQLYEIQSLNLPMDSNPQSPQHMVKYDNANTKPVRTKHRHKKRTLSKPVGSPNSSVDETPPLGRQNEKSRPRRQRKRQSKNSSTQLEVHEPLANDLNLAAQEDVPLSEQKENDNQLVEEIEADAESEALESALEDFLDYMSSSQYEDALELDGGQEVDIAPEIQENNNFETNV